MHDRQRLRLAIAGNYFALFIFVVFISTSQSSDVGNKFWRKGWSDDFYIGSIAVNTPGRYWGLLFSMAFVKIIQIISEEFAMPILGFTIYNPDRQVIGNFGKNELQVYGNLMFMCSNLRNVFMILISVTQIDVALFNVAIGEITSAFMIRWLLNRKTFVHAGCDETAIDYSDLNGNIPLDPEKMPNYVDNIDNVKFLGVLANTYNQVSSNAKS